MDEITSAQLNEEADLGAITLRWLVAQRDLDLRVLHDSGSDFAVIHPVELEDPTEFVGEGCVILLTGIAFRERPDGLAEYVRRVAANGVRGIGFGVGIAHEAVPDDMVDAAQEADISLFVIPRRIPFISILSTVHAELARQRNRSREQLLEMQERLNVAATEGGLERLMREASACLGAHLLLSDNDGRWAELAWGKDLPDIDLNAVQELLRSRGFGVAARVGEFNVIIHPLGHQGERVHGLIAASRDKISANSRALLRHCAGLAELIVHRPDAYRRTHQELNSLALAIQLGISQSNQAMENVFDSVRDSQGFVRPVLLTSDHPRSVDRSLSALDTTLSKRGRIMFSLRIDKTKALILFRGDRSVAETLDLLSASRRGTRIAIGATVSWHDLDREVVQELERTTVGLHAGEAVGPEAHALSWLKEADVQRALSRRARQTWEKLRPHPDLERTLEAYLRNSGNVSRTADDLETHRHTVSKRIGALESIIECDLTDSVVAAELLIVAVAQRQGWTAPES